MSPGEVAHRCEIIKPINDKTVVPVIDEGYAQPPAAGIWSRSY